METFTSLKQFVHNPGFQRQREKSLKRLNIRIIDKPVRGLIQDLAKLSYCFTLQSCYGHFLNQGDESFTNVESEEFLKESTQIEYRIAYIALSIQRNERGEQLLKDLKSIEEINPEYIQLGCAEWFWKRQLNSFIVQIEPKNYQTKDRVCLNFREALKVERIRNKAFNHLKKIIIKKLN